MTEVQIHEQQQPAMAFVEAQFPIPEPVPKVAPEQEEWVKAGEAARSIEQPPAALVAQVPPAILERMEVSRPMSEAPVVDVLFESSRNVRTTESRQPVVESKLCRKTNSTLSRVRIAFADFASSCFSTSRSIVVTCGLVMLSGFLIIGIEPSDCLGHHGRVVIEVKKPHHHSSTNPDGFQEKRLLFPPRDRCAGYLDPIRRGMIGARY